MTIDKLPSGSYRIRKQIDHKTYSATVDHRPTIKEANAILAEKVKRPTGKTPLKSAAEAYIDSRRNIVSPSTIRGYMKLVRGIPEAFAGLSIQDMRSADLQALVNAYAPGRSPKTVKNMSCFISAVLRENDIILRQPTLPQKEAKEIYIPTADDVRRIFEYLKGSDYEIPITLAALGLRRSEIAALVPADLNGNRLTINKALVQDERGDYVLKSTKTTASTRVITIPEHIAERIREQGFVYDKYISKMYYALQGACDALGIPRFPLHKLRHFYASYMHDLGYSDAQIAEIGGWRDGSRVMKQVYRHAMGVSEAAASMAADIDRLSGQEKSCHETVTKNRKSRKIKGFGA